jgi:SAM-dependent MidA family methyltransferase
MEMALYEPGLGYYVAGMRKLGAGGDFVTAPEISPLFSQCIAHQCAGVLSRIQSGDILEMGAGTGNMACDILLELERTGSLPDHYYILDISPELKARQKETFERKAPHLLNKINWLDALPEKFQGVILGNEVLDAMPVEVFSIKDSGEIIEHTVKWHEQQLVASTRPADPTLVEKVKRLGLQSPQTNNYTSELNPNLPGWMKAIADCLESGAVILVDYGYTHKEYYHPDRASGTLICHYQHRVHDEPLLYPGLQDITANVDFTAVADAAIDADLEVSGFTNQASFLAGCGLEELFIRALNDKPDKQYKLAQQIRTLSLPAEMGERFKVIALTREWDTPLKGFSFNDYRHHL